MYVKYIDLSIDEKSTIMYREYPHLKFLEQWKLTENSNFYLGQCDAFVKAINNTPIMPQHFKELMKVAFIKGAQATTAIEGNTLSDDEIGKLYEGEKLPPSKEYQEKEVKNILDAFQNLFDEVVDKDTEEYISPDFLLRLHKMVGKELGEHFQAVPGRFRESDVVVGRYRCPDYRDVKSLIDKFCDFSQSYFKFKEGKQSFKDVIIQAIVSHVYLEWIHPFNDGNGRTGRLLEFYILLRGGNPNIALHILSNHYNFTRTEYYRQLELAHSNKDLTSFIEYALLGFRDGLENTLNKIQFSLFEQAWRRYIYDKFDEMKIINKEVFKRRRTLALEMPINGGLLLNEIPDYSIRLAKLYSNLSNRTLIRDIEDLKSMEIVLKLDDNKYYSNTTKILSMIASRRIRKSIN
jgi:Fic family protein